MCAKLLSSCVQWGLRVCEFEVGGMVSVVFWRGIGNGSGNVHEEG